MRLRHAAFLAAPLLVACSMLPGSGAPGMPADRGTHTVVYTVRCEQCTVGYTTGTAMATEEMKGLWAKTVRLENSISGMVTLTAFPRAAGALVSHAYIEIDGRRVAEERRNSHEAFSNQVTLTAHLPGFTVGGSQAPSQR